MFNLTRLGVGSRVPSCRSYLGRVGIPRYSLGLLVTLVADTSSTVDLVEDRASKGVLVEAGSCNLLIGVARAVNAG